MSIPKISKEDARELAYGDDRGPEGSLWTVETDAEILDTSRWSIHKERVIRHTSSKRYFLLAWSEGATECQDEEPFEYNEPELVECERKLVSKVEWVPKETK